MKELLEEFDVMSDFTAEMQEAYLLSDVMDYIKLNGYNKFREQLNKRLEEDYLKQMASLIDSKAGVQHNGW